MAASFDIYNFLDHTVRKKLDFFQFFSFEAKIAEVRKEVGETKEKVADVREDVRYVIAQQNALSASVKSINTQAVTVNYDRPAQEQVDAAAAEVAGVEPVEPAESDPLFSGFAPEDKLMQAIFGGRDEIATNNLGRSQLADLFVDFEAINEVRKINKSERVAILRIRIERELKNLLKVSMGDLSKGSQNVRRPIPMRELVKAATNLHPELSGQRESFDVFYRIASAAIHADEVPAKDLDTAIYLGERLLGLLTKIAPQDPID